MNPTCGAAREKPSEQWGKKKKGPESARTVVIHRLLEALAALLQHLPVDVDDVYTRFTVSVGLAGMIEDAQRDIPCSARDINAADRAP
jgi:hypothetical protein